MSMPSSSPALSPALFTPPLPSRASSTFKARESISTDADGRGSSSPSNASVSSSSAATRRWPLSLSSSSGGGVGASSSYSNNDGKVKHNKKQQQSSSSKQSLSVKSKMRPESTSTIGSYASANPFSYDESQSPYSKKVPLPTPRSSTSSISKTYTEASAKEKNFEQLLASGETWVKSETADVARGNSSLSIDVSGDSKYEGGGGLAERYSMKRKPSSMSKSNVESPMLELEEEDEEWSGYEDDGADGHLSTPKPGSADETLRHPPKSPMRPPKSSERNSPSATMSTLSHYSSSAHEPTGTAAAPATEATVQALPKHPHSRKNMNQNASSTPPSSSSSPPPPGAALAQTDINQSLMRPQQGKSKSKALPPIVSSSGRRHSQSPTSPNHSISSQTTYTGNLKKSSSVAQDIQDMQYSGNDPSSPSSRVNGFKDRLKKTSGFLRRWGGSNGQEKNSVNPAKPPRMTRKASQSSFASEGGASTSHSARSVPDPYVPRWGNEDDVPVPVIPSKYKDSAASAANNTSTPRARTLPSIDSAGSQSTTLSGHNRHKRATSSSAGGSAGSASTEMRHTLQAWEHEMDATLKASGQDLDRRMRIEKPSPNWTPSPKLPEYKLNRKSSFMDEAGEHEQKSHSVELSNTSSLAASRKPGVHSLDSQLLSPSTPIQAQRSSSLSANAIPLSPLSMQARTAFHAEGHASPPAMSSSPSIPSEGDSVIFKRTRDADPSAMSFETAIDRPSYFVRHRFDDEGDEEVVDSKRRFDGLVSSPDEESVESSIRLIPTGEDRGSSSYKASTTLDSLLAGSGQPRHAKDRTITRDTSSRSSSPIIEVRSASVSHSIDEATMSAKEMALKCWQEDESFKRKEKIAEWLGGVGTINRAARKHYIDHFAFHDLRVDVAFRKLCDKLYLRAETQQIDRILASFSQRYYECNPQTKAILFSPDVVHALVFSILLLNTDLHVADIQERMTRSQFVRNTLSAIQESSDMIPAQAPSGVAKSAQSIKSQDGVEAKTEPPAISRTLSLPATGTSASGAVAVSSQRAGDDSLSMSGSEPLKDDTRDSSQSRAWEVEMEGLLKEIYNAVRGNRIRLPMTESSNAAASFALQQQQQKSLRVGSDRINALKRGSIRGIQGLLGANSSTYRSDENLSMSRASLNSTQVSFSDHLNQSTPSTSMASASSFGLLQTGTLAPTLGFANTLSQSIIREAKDEDDDASVDSANDDLTDDELALMGPPWAKEGMLTRKHYWESPLKRAKDKTWTDCFVVVQQGTLSMFRFGDQQSQSHSINTTGVAIPEKKVGGGNWLSNAICLGEFSLAHTLANSLPPPGYNRSRPHVFALTLPNGSVYFFQTGHEELVQEWVSTCNYWAARKSREPLGGGVSNMEYGWNRVLPTPDADGAEDDMDSSGHSSGLMHRPSISKHNSNADARSIRSGKSNKSLRMRATNNAMFQGRQSNASTMSSSPNLSSSYRASSALTASDRPVYINEWRPPAPPTVSSTLSEEDQLEACQRHRARVEEELTQHNLLRQPMIDYLQQFSTSSHGNNALLNKAIANFDKKASYLLSDLTKFTLYTATLTSANKLKSEKRDARQLNRMMLKADEELSRVKEEEEGPPISSSS